MAMWRASIRSPGGRRRAGSPVRHVHEPCRLWWHGTGGIDHSTSQGTPGPDRATRSGSIRVGSSENGRTLTLHPGQWDALSYVAGVTRRERRPFHESIQNA